MTEIQPRSVIGTPEPPSSRSKLPANTKSVLVHYVGSGSYGNGNQSDLADAQSIASYGISAGKTWEYNYLIGWQGNIYEQAGDYQAAHCSNFNSKSYGILMMLGVGIKPTDSMINAYWWLINHLISTKQISSSHEKVPHYRYRATICCNTQLAEYPHGSNTSSPTGEGSLGNLLTFLLNSPEDDLPFTQDQIKQMIRDVLNEAALFGTGSNNWPWAETFQNLSDQMRDSRPIISDTDETVDRLEQKMNAMDAKLDELLTRTGNG